MVVVSRFVAAGVCACVAVSGLVAGPASGVAGGVQADEGEFGFAARVQVTETRSCSGVLVAPRWVLTAAECFASGTTPVTAGALPAGVKVLVGRSDVAEASRVVGATEVVPHPERGVVLVRLERQVTGVDLAVLPEAEPQVGQDVRVTGYGRTATTWRSEDWNVGEFEIGRVSSTAMEIVGTATEPASACAGDAGGPVVTGQGDEARVVALIEDSWQAGCLGSAETRNGAQAVRVDELGSWVSQMTRENPRGDLDGDGRGDLVALYDCSSGGSQMWRFLGVADRSLPLRYWSGCDDTWDWATNKMLVGDFDGDGRSDLLSVFREANTAVTMRVLLDAASGKGTWQQGWSGGAGGIGFAGVKAVAGDYNGDGRDDVAFLHQFSQKATDPPGEFDVALWVFDDVVGGDTYQQIWRVSVSKWNWEQTKLLAGDFTKDGRDDLASVYRDENGKLGIRLDDQVATPVATPEGTNEQGPRFRQAWLDNDPSLKWARTKPVAGDFTGDGVDDVAILYRTAGTNDTPVNTRLWLFDDVAGAAPYQTMWSDLDLAKPWNWELAEVTAGDFNGDGRADLAAMHPDSQNEGSELRVAFEVAKKGAEVSTLWRDDMESGGPVWVPGRVKFAAVNQEAS